MESEERCEARPGALIRKERLRRGWTLAEASARTGVPISTLSRAENDKISLTYDKLASISRGLEIDISALFGGEATPPQPKVLGRRSITKADGGRRIETANYGHSYLAADLLNKPFIPVVADIRARSLAEFGDLVRHEGEEFAFVLEGVVMLHTSLYAPVRLETGDSIYFDSGMGHAYVAAGDGPCRVLSICTGEEAQLIAGHEVETPPFRIQRYANGH